MKSSRFANKINAEMVIVEKGIAEYRGGYSVVGFFMIFLFSRFIIKNP